MSGLERHGTYRSILVAIDDSLASEEALRHAIGLAEAQRARLTVLTVASDRPGLGETLAVAAGGMLPADHVQAGERLLRAAVERVPADQPVTMCLRIGSAAEQIVAAAVEGCHDLIVMGSRVHGPLSSVSRKVLRRSPVPVLVLHAEPCGRPAEDERPAPQALGAVAPRLAGI